MQTRCPNCGKELLRPINRGIKSCIKCHSFFEVNDANKLLGASWELRKYPIMGFDQFQFVSKLSVDDAHMVYKHVVDECCSHDEFLKIILKKYQSRSA